ncbi:MAG: hypothetical protein EOO85_15085 [Pedobacter sp.]|nr:MAG: hypothetical protein EOO85_15085 [Pedobacter sp.]
MEVRLLKNLEYQSVYLFIKARKSYQQTLIKTCLSIQSFPTYMLIDKEGNISTMKAPRPSDQDKLTATINDMLK